jgi:hypothetical protein
MQRQWWDKTVTVQTGKLGQALTINSTERAAEFLMLESPAEPEGEAYSAAKIALVDAYEGRISIDAARDAFIAAAREAGIFVIDK